MGFQWSGNQFTNGLGEIGKAIAVSNHLAFRVEPETQCSEQRNVLQRIYPVTAVSVIVSGNVITNIPISAVYFKLHLSWRKHDKCHTAGIARPSAPRLFTPGLGRRFIPEQDAENA
jgi:hypothetical protein